MKEYGLAPQHIITVPILVGTDGVEKMGKSTGKTIAVTAPPDEMFGAIMSLPDSAMRDYFVLLTDLLEEELAGFEREMAAGRLNPRDAKLGLAREIVSVLHSPDAARQSEAEFLRVFSQRKTPSEMPSFVLSQPMTIVELLADAGLARSMSKARRLVQQGGVRLDGQRVRDIHARVALPMGSDELTLRVGRRRFLRLIKPDDKENNTNDARADATD